jgi:hypothetical protein
MFIVDAGFDVAIYFPSAVCISNIIINQCIRMLFNDKECFNHRVTTKICTVQQYLSHNFKDGVRTKSFKIFIFVPFTLFLCLWRSWYTTEAGTQQNPQTLALLGVWFLRNWPTVLPEDGI